MSVFSSCAGFDSIRIGKLLHPKGFLATPVLNVLEGIQSAAEARSALLAAVTSLSASAISYFVNTVLPEIGLEEIAHSIQQCPGNSECSLQSHQYHNDVSFIIVFSCHFQRQGCKSTFAPAKTTPVRGVGHLHDT